MRLALVDPPKPAIQELLRAVFHRFENDLGSGVVDAYPSPQWGEKFEALPESVKLAHSELAHIPQEGKRRRDPLMAIEVELSNPRHRDLFVAFAPWSINATAHLQDGTEIAGIHDHASFSVSLSSSEEEWFRSIAAEVGIPPQDLKRF